MRKRVSLVLFATFSPWENQKRLPTNGMVEPMLNFFLPRISNFTLIDQPHPESDRLLPIIEIYKHGKLQKKTSTSLLTNWLHPFLLLRNSDGTRIPFKLRDFISVLDFVLRKKTTYDIFIGLESINTLAGILLKKIGKIKTIVYYVSDYSPNRYRSRLFNSVYLWLDKIAAMHADYIWDVSPAMMPARVKAGLNKQKAAPVIHVPNALFPQQITFLPKSQIKPNTLVFAGTLGEENGPDLAVEALKIVVNKIPEAKLHIFGGGKEDLNRLKNLACKFGLQKNVVLHGFFTNQLKLSREIRKYAIGLAPYKAVPNSPRWYADATKIRLYLAAGLPVVTTQVPPLGKELVKNGAGIRTKDNATDLARAIIKLLRNTKLYSKMKKNAIKAAKNNTWENSYTNALKEMGISVTPP